MGINLVPEVSNFSLKDVYFLAHNSEPPAGVFPIQNGSVEEGCITEGRHRILAFATTVNNKGDENLVIGDPANRPDIFESAPHMPEGWITKENFYLYSLKDSTGTQVANGFKRAWCIMDHSTFNCKNQGISVGDHDTYNTNQNCQFLLATNLRDGEVYTFEVTVNPSQIFKEDNYDDNKATKKIKIRGRIVEEINK
jgi:hypothetical protein